MKRAAPGRRLPVALADEAVAAFLRGFVATALLDGLQGRRSIALAADRRALVRHAVQGGAALSAATVAAQAVMRRDYSLAVTAVAAGAAGLLAAERLLPSPDRNDIEENDFGQEEA